MRMFEYVKRVKIYGKNKITVYGVRREVKRPDFRLPERSTSKSAGYDFYCPEKVEIPPYKLGNKPTLVPTGVKVYMPDDEFLMLVNRSSNPSKKFLVVPNSMGIIDADYVDNPDNEGEMMFAFYNVSDKPVVIEKGDKLGQGIFVKYGMTDNDNAEGQRTGGFGSTGI